MNNYKLEEVSFTTHILERYVERTMNKSGNDIKTYLAQNEDIIKERLLMLYNSAEFLWSGKIKEHNFTHFYINKDGWVIVVDQGGKKLITVYKIDLELDSDFNKIYVSKVKEKIESMNNLLEEKQQILSVEKEKNLKEIECLQKENTLHKEKIEYNNSVITTLKQENENMTKECNLLEKEQHHIIEKFLNARIF